jgi:Protein of unknown function (DUF3106)
MTTPAGFGGLPRARVRAWAVACLTMVAACGIAVAQAPAPPAKPPAATKQSGPTWQALTPAQRSALAPLQGDWSSIDASNKAKWLEIASRYPSLPAEEQARMQARMNEWSRLSPADRGRARVTFQETKQLPAQERQAQWQAYQALPESQRRALASRAQPEKSAVPAKPPPSAGKPEPGPSTKRNVVVSPSQTAKPAKSVGPTVVQASPGATTTLVTRQPAPPAHQQTGMPKIAATPGFVDESTLLPKRGPQGAAARSPNPAPATKP